MFNRIHQKLGTAGFIISIVALVAALGGGAYAASGGLSGKQKKEVAKISKKFAGKPGAAGAAGPAGPAGAAGAKGANGAAGANGTNGTNGINGTNGANGLTGFTKTLPKGETETGTFDLLFFSEEDQGYPGTALSFSIPLASPLTGAEVHLIAPNGEELEKTSSEPAEESPPTECGAAIKSPGGPEINAANPKAAPGNLCVYIGGTEIEALIGDMGSRFINDPSQNCRLFGCSEGGASTSGARLYALGSEPYQDVYGTWAVTAPTS